MVEQPSSQSAFGSRASSPSSSSFPPYDSQVRMSLDERSDRPAPATATSSWRRNREGTSDYDVFAGAGATIAGPSSSAGGAAAQRPSRGRDSPPFARHIPSLPPIPQYDPRPSGGRDEAATLSRSALLSGPTMQPPPSLASSRTNSHQHQQLQQQQPANSSGRAGMLGSRILPPLPPPPHTPAILPDHASSSNSSSARLAPSRPSLPTVSSANSVHARISSPEIGWRTTGQAGPSRGPSDGFTLPLQRHSQATSPGSTYSQSSNTVDGGGKKRRRDESQDAGSANSDPHAPHHQQRPPYHHHQHPSQRSSMPPQLSGSSTSGFPPSYADRAYAPHQDRHSFSQHQEQVSSAARAAPHGPSTNLTFQGAVRPSSPAPRNHSPPPYPNSQHYPPTTFLHGGPFRQQQQQQHRNSPMPYYHASASSSGGGGVGTGAGGEGGNGGAGSPDDDFSADDGGHSPGGEGTSYTDDGGAAAEAGAASGSASRKAAKINVRIACSNCKKAHLACDNQRPCGRCSKIGKAESCVDVQHKKRGRPRGERKAASDTVSRNGRSSLARAGKLQLSASHRGDGFSSPPLPPLLPPLQQQQHQHQHQHQHQQHGQQQHPTEGMGSMGPPMSALSSRATPLSDGGSFTKPSSGATRPLMTAYPSSGPTAPQTRHERDEQQQDVQAAPLPPTPPPPSPVLTLICSTDLQIASYEPAHVRLLLGYEAEEMDGHCLLDLVHPDDVGRLRAMWLDLLGHARLEISNVIASPLDGASGQPVLALTPPLHLVLPARGTGVLEDQSVRVRSAWTRGRLFDLYSIRLHIGGGLGTDLTAAAAEGRREYSAYVVASLLKLGNEGAHPDLRIGGTPPSTAVSTHIHNG